MPTINLTTGFYSYATGANIGDGAVGGTNHIADVASTDMTLDDLMLTFDSGDFDATAGAFRLEPGDTVGFQFTDAAGNVRTVTNGTVQQTNFGDAGVNETGVFTIQGVDQNGNAIALLWVTDNIVPGGIPVNQRFYDNYTDAAAIDPDNVFITCFSAGAAIETQSGEVKVQDLKVGDLVKTADHGFQPIRWIGSRKLDAIDLAAHPKLRPVRIKAGALGNNLPSEDLLLSRQHRVLVSSEIVQRVCNEDDALVAAIKLIDHPGIEIDAKAQDVEYFHLLFDRHEIIYSNQAPTESLFPGIQALKALSKDAYTEIVTLFPEIEEPDYEPVPARFIPSLKEQKLISTRHIKNDKAYLRPVDNQDSHWV